MLWINRAEVTWIPITKENLIGNEFLCIKNYQTEILKHKEDQLIGVLNEYYTLLENLQGVFYTNYFDTEKKVSFCREILIKLLLFVSGLDLS